MNIAEPSSKVLAWKTRKSVMGTIYAIVTDDGDRVKIGFTTNLPVRRYQLLNQANYYGRLTDMVGSVLGTYADEQRIHSELKPQSLRVTSSHGPREMYPASVLSHPACRAVFGPPTKKRARAA